MRAALFALAVACVLSPALAGDGRTPIYEPSVINQPGSYVLTRDLFGGSPVIRVLADQVDLDLNGFTIEVQEGGVGIQVESASDVRIHGGAVRSGRIGISASECSSLSIESVEIVRADEYGLEAVQVAALHLADLRVVEAGLWGLNLVDVTNARLHDIALGVKTDATGALMSRVAALRAESWRVFASANDALRGLRLSSSSGGLVDRIALGTSLRVGMEAGQVEGTAFRFVTARHEGSGNALTLDGADNLLAFSRATNANVGLISETIRALFLANASTFNGDGITLFAQSDDGVLRQNVARGNSRDDFLDEGTGNDSGSDNFLPNLF